MSIYDSILKFFDTGVAPNQKELQKSTHNTGINVPTIQSFLANDSEITEEEVMSIPAFKASIELISSSVAQLPIRLIDTSEKENQVIDDDYRLNLLNYSPNPTMNGFNFKKKIVHDAILYGTSKSFIEYADDSSNTVNAIYPFDMKEVKVDVYTAQGYKKFGKVTLMNQSGTYEYYDDGLLSILRDTEEGIIGKGIVRENDKLLRLALQQRTYEDSLLANGAVPSAVLQTDQKLEQSVLDRIVSQFTAKYAGASNAARTIILERGLEFKQTSLDPDSLQLVDGKKSVISDIARIFNIPESMINSAANKYDSAEQNNLWFLQHTLAPYLVSIENALNHTLLTEDERQKGYKFLFDTSDLLRMTNEELTEITMTKFNGGLISNFEAKRTLGEHINENEKEYYKLTTGMVIYRADNGNIINPNTGQTTNDNGEIIHQGVSAKGSFGGVSTDSKEPTDTDTDTATSDKKQEEEEQ